jgi:hypothetical protein
MNYHSPTYPYTYFADFYVSKVVDFVPHYLKNDFS